MIQQNKYKYILIIIAIILTNCNSKGNQKNEINLFYAFIDSTINCLNNKRPISSIQYSEKKRKMVANLLLNTVDKGINKDGFYNWSVINKHPAISIREALVQRDSLNIYPIQTNYVYSIYFVSSLYDRCDSKLINCKLINCNLISYFPNKRHTIRFWPEYKKFKSPSDTSGYRKIVEFAKQELNSNSMEFDFNKFNMCWIPSS
jgi:hypothetical protein